VGRLIGVCVNNQVGDEQPDRYLATKTIGEMLCFRGGDDVVVPSVKQVNRRRGRGRSCWREPDTSCRKSGAFE
jgi:hypothetical protein